MMRDASGSGQPKAGGIDATGAGASGTRLWSRLNAWRALRAVWLEPDPPEFQWRLLRYFALSRAAVALVLLLFISIPASMRATCRHPSATPCSA